MSVDMFCAGDDRHRVALLEDLLQQAGQTVTLHTAAVTEPSAPCLIACTARSLREPWIVELFASAPLVVALRLDDTPLPGPCQRVIDMQSWPARSADRKVGALVNWLLRHGGGPAAAAVQAEESSHVRSRAGFSLLRERLARTANVGDGSSASGVVSRRRRTPSSEAGRVLIILAVLGGVGALLWSSARERADDTAAASAVALDDAAAAQIGAAVPPADFAAASPAALAGAPDPLPSPDLMAPGTGGGAAIGATASPLSHAVDGGDSPVVSRVADAGGGSGQGDRIAGAGGPDTPTAAAPAAGAPVAPVARKDAGNLPAAGHADALAHLCAARSLAAARAWALTLNWKQRRRATSEACVARLLARPGYQVLRLLLEP